MINLIAKHWIVNYKEYQDRVVRQKYGILCGIVGICLNICLFAWKLLAGWLSQSIAITADAFNNLSDAGSSLILLFGFRLAGQKPDSEHPFGHGRLEYVAGLIVSMIIILMAVELMRTSAGKILHPEEVSWHVWTLVVLIVSILVKMYMFLYNRTIGNKIASAAMRATALDSISDAVATFVVLLSTIISHFTGLQIDGCCGLLVGLFILYAGISAAKDTINPLLGQPAEECFVEKVHEIVLQNFLLAFPLFFLVGLGSFSAKVSLIDFNVGKGLAKFAFNIAIPCLLFQTIRGASNLPPPNWSIGLAYFGSCALVFLLTFFIGRKSFHLRGDESTVFGMSAIFSNNVQLGIPLAISLLGENCVPSIAFIVSLNVFLLWVSVTVGVELSRSREASVWGTCFEGLWRTIKNPVIIGILLGLLSSWADIGLPEPFEKSLTLLSASATPVALFSVGTGLSRYKLSSHVRLTGASIFLKLFIQPATVFILCFLFGITGIERQAACLLASLPVGVNVYIMAQEFEVIEGPVANALLLTTCLSMLTVPLMTSLFNFL